HGHAPHRPRFRRRRRSAPPAGPCRGRRPGGLATADALHHAGVLHLHGALSPPRREEAQPSARAGPRGRLAVVIGTRGLEEFFRDCRYGLRTLRRSPMFTSVAILSLALGIGANTAIFSLMDRVMFRMMPVREPERLVQITRFHPPYGRSHMSYPLVSALEKGLDSFEGLLAEHPLGVRDIT